MYNIHFKVVLLNKLIHTYIHAYIHTYIYIYIYIYNIVHVNKKYKFDKCTLIIKLYQILFDDNIVIFDYNMFNFKIYLILKL